MRSQDVEHSCYPIAALPNGEGRYKVTSMIGLDAMSEHLLPYEVANTIATSANSLHRASRKQGWHEHGISPEVQSWIKAVVAAYTDAVIGYDAVVG